MKQRKAIEEETLAKRVGEVSFDSLVLYLSRSLVADWRGWIYDRKSSWFSVELDRSLLSASFWRVGGFFDTIDERNGRQSSVVKRENGDLAISKNPSACLIDLVDSYPTVCWISLKPNKEKTETTHNKTKEKKIQSHRRQSKAKTKNCINTIIINTNGHTHQNQQAFQILPI